MANSTLNMFFLALSSAYRISPTCPGPAEPGNPFGMFAVFPRLDRDGQLSNYFQVRASVPQESSALSSDGPGRVDC